MNTASPFTEFGELPRRDVPAAHGADHLVADYQPLHADYPVETVTRREATAVIENGRLSVHDLMHRGVEARVHDETGERVFILPIGDSEIDVGESVHDIDFVDLDEETGNIDEKVLHKLECVIAEYGLDDEELGELYHAYAEQQEREHAARHGHTHVHVEGKEPDEGAEPEHDHGPGHDKTHDEHGLHIHDHDDDHDHDNSHHQFPQALKHFVDWLENMFKNLNEQKPATPPEVAPPPRAIDVAPMMDMDDDDLLATMRGIQVDPPAVLTQADPDPFLYAVRLDDAPAVAVSKNDEPRVLVDDRDREPLKIAAALSAIAMAHRIRVTVLRKGVKPALS